MKQTELPYALGNTIKILRSWAAEITEKTINSGYFQVNFGNYIAILNDW